MRTRTAPMLAAVMVLSSCATTGAMDVTTESDPAKRAQVAAYKTYSWAPQPPGYDPTLYPPGVETNVKNAVNAILQGRGYRLVEPADAPDFKIGWHAAVETKLKQSSVDVHYGYYSAPYGVGVSKPIVQEYDVGTLVLDVADSAGNQLVWRGVANAQIDRDVSEKEKRERIQKAAAKILERFPPKPE